METSHWLILSQTLMRKCYLHFFGHFATEFLTELYRNPPIRGEMAEANSDEDSFIKTLDC